MRTCQCTIFRLVSNCVLPEPCGQVDKALYLSLEPWIYRGIDSVCSGLLALDLRLGVAPGHRGYSVGVQAALWQGQGTLERRFEVVHLQIVRFAPSPTVGGFVFGDLPAPCHSRRQIGRRAATSPAQMSAQPQQSLTRPSATQSVALAGLPTEADSELAVALLTAWVQGDAGVQSAFDCFIMRRGNARLHHLEQQHLFWHAEPTAQLAARLPSKLPGEGHEQAGGACKRCTRSVGSICPHAIFLHAALTSCSSATGARAAQDPETVRLLQLMAGGLFQRAGVRYYNCMLAALDAAQLVLLHTDQLPSAPVCCRGQWAACAVSAADEAVRFGRGRRSDGSRRAGRTSSATAEHA